MSVFTAWCIGILIGYLLCALISIAYIAFRWWWDTFGEALKESFIDWTKRRAS